MSERYGDEMFGDTEFGRKWCKFALNPAHGMMECMGIPDGAEPVIHLDRFQYALDVAAPFTSGATELYDYKLTFVPDVLAMVDVKIHPRSNLGDYSKSYTALNPLLGGYRDSVNITDQAERIAYDTQTYIEMARQLRERFPKIRISGAKITIEMDSNQNADQGRIQAVQQLFSPKKNTVLYNGGDEPMMIKSHTYRASDFPTYQNSLSMGKVYTNQAREGGFHPMFLGSTFDFVDVDTEVAIRSPKIGSGHVTGSNPPVDVIPIPEFRSTIQDGTAGVAIQGDRITTVFLNGITPGTTFTVRVAFIMEGVPLTNSSAATNINLAPKLDPAALYAYKMIRDEYLVAGYPAEWNSSGELLSRIGNFLKNRVLPVVSEVATGAMEGYSKGGVAGAVAGAGENLAGAVWKQIMLAQKRRRDEEQAVETAKATADQIAARPKKPNYKPRQQFSEVPEDQYDLPDFETETTTTGQPRRVRRDDFDESAYTF